MAGRQFRFKKGRRYQLRNGWTASKLQLGEFFGHGVKMLRGVVDQNGQQLHWHPDGHYAPEVGQRPHPYDIVREFKGEHNRGGSRARAVVRRPVKAK